ncbi:MAG: hypothetical protein H6Q76_1918, partial [Firmicutes bacterium]|nr:hypothetical protein [Bacillota bacterium]
MRIQPLFFASPVYYEQERFLSDAGTMMKLVREIMPEAMELLEPLYLNSQAGVDSYLAGCSNATPLLVNLSGATQRWVLSVAKAAKQSLLWWYFPGEGLFAAPVEQTIRQIVAKNAVPAVMDCWAHLRNRHVQIEKVFDKASLQEKCRLLSAMDK